MSSIALRLSSIVPYMSALVCLCFSQALTAKFLKIYIMAIAKRVKTVKATPIIQCFVKKVIRTPTISKIDVRSCIENVERNCAKVFTSPSIFSIISPGLCSL